MSAVLLLGATGRTGGRALTELLGRGVAVCAIVRSAERLPVDVVSDPLLTVVEADVATLPVEELRGHLAGCATAISCLGHRVSLRGVFGPPRDLVERAVRAVCRAAEARGPDAPLRLILMSSVSVNGPVTVDARRRAGERAFLWALRGLVPPARDNQRAADVLADEIGAEDPHVGWVVVRPDTLIEGDASAYRTHDGLVASLFKPDSTRMANVAHFMAELATDEASWRRWRGQMPVIVDAPPSEAASS